VGTPVPISPGVDVTAYRIVQEALTNTIRHSRAIRASVRLCYEPGFVTVSITDEGERPDGKPAEPGQLKGRPAALLTGSGLGLAGIAERVASCGGHLTVGPTPGAGFNVTARLPSR
jgi:signal transduction histidine kinase